MSVPAAYLGVILIWTTTPLAIQWSAQGPGFLFGVTARMVIGLAVAMAVVRLMGVSMRWHRRARRTYLAAGMGIFLAMGCTYWASQFIPSGWISVMFGLSPIVTGLMARAWLDSQDLSRARIIGMLIGVGGLVLVFSHSLKLGVHAGWGIAAMLAAVLFHCASAVGIKRIDAGLHGLVVTTGGLMVAVPLFLLSWFVSGNTWPVEVSLRPALSIAYLGVVGSVLGFALYFFILHRIDATRVALITLITPVLALMLGHWLNAEPVSVAVWAGTALILAGLLLYQFGDGWIERWVPAGSG